MYWLTKNPRALLDVPMLGIAGLMAQNLSEIIMLSLLKFHTISLPVNILVFLIFFTVVICLYKLFIEKVWKPIFISIISRLIIIVIAIVTVGILYINLFISLKQNLFSLAMFNLVIEATYFILMFIFSLILTRTIQKENRIKRKEIEHQQLLDYMTSLERINQDMQKFRHDYQNILLTMQEHINKNDLPALKSYFNERIVKVEEQTLIRNYLYNQLDKLELLELKGLIATKILIADQHNIAMNIEIPEVIEKIAFDMIDLNRIVGILLDNAIEASREVDDPELNIALIKKNDASVLIIIENRIDGAEIDISRVFERHYTTKRDHRGMGLATVKEILTNHPHAIMNTRIEQNFFIHELSIESLDSHVVNDLNTALRDLKGKDQKGAFT